VFRYAAKQFPRSPATAVRHLEKKKEKASKYQKKKKIKKNTYQGSEKEGRRRRDKKKTQRLRPRQTCYSRACARVCACARALLSLPLHVIGGGGAEGGKKNQKKKK